MSSAERASENNQQRDLGYPKETFDELVERYEEPIGTNKWDSPLFNIDPATDMTESFEQICRALLTEKAKKPPSFATSAVTYGFSLVALSFLEISGCLWTCNFT